MEVLCYLNEIWKDIKGFEGIYQVSNFGRVKSLERMVKHYPSGEKVVKEKIISQHKRRIYYAVTLCKDGNCKNYSVHRLVAEAFIPNPDNLPCVNHKDENPENNNACNLEWCTFEYNINWGTANKRRSKKLKGTKKSDEFINKHSKAVLQYDLNGELINEYKSATEVKNINGFNSTHISSCCNGNRKTAYGYVWKFK